ncbi:MAG TPA: 2Fe-2S iron-sulfur cluster-binding protein [Chitinophagales bacterium]|nr:2Fe-2S iron-sulfur cluster-binding protein [Chitinophagales bacterium]HMZ34778.1 2Fe-2S iron-sulfur cluster-binding protein [Chitinophagales bacterium]HNA39267.1 2Fe-2S iron-sulfur cluster-binding protein [Chitinophagales bacterium]HNF52306.1 2Fe-2S iron-sulfur cluster-binding protein [Chitinophagales bacterium]HNJ02342.1 2Fe-2S iron-sulfur cluster-binding protein [Chitinophagales bacterium]
MKLNIKFIIVENKIQYPIEIFEGEYRNLMALINDKIYPDYFGECGGLGRCATCLVKVEGLSGVSVKKERNEPVTLLKNGLTDENIRLSCQLLISKDLDGTIVEVVEYNQ